MDYGTDFDTSERASPVPQLPDEAGIPTRVGTECLRFSAEVFVRNFPRDMMQDRSGLGVTQLPHSINFPSRFPLT